jgi:predicted outer membrane repeat protein
MRITNVTFHNNTAGKSVSLVALFLEMVTFLLIPNYSQGGAMLATGSSTEVEIRASSFVDNKTPAANGNGGAISVYEAWVTVRGTKFERNQAGQRGGAIRAMPGNLTMYTSTFTANKAESSDGGAIYAKGLRSGSVDAGAIVEIRSCEFESNSAAKGGAIFFSSGAPAGFLLITTTTFSTNEAGDAGAIHTAGANAIAEIHASVFWGNIASSDSSGAISVYSQALLINASTFDSNSCASDGGAIRAIQDSTLTVYTSTFERNQAQRVGGAIHIQKNSALRFWRSAIQINHATRGGGVSIKFGTLDIDSSTFQNNEADVAGGAIFSETSDAMVIKSSYFEANMAASDEGHVLASSADNLNMITMDDVTLEEAATGQQGSLILLGSHCASCARDNGDIAYSSLELRGTTYLPSNRSSSALPDLLSVVELQSGAQLIFDKSNNLNGSKKAWTVRNGTNITRIDPASCKSVWLNTHCATIEEGLVVPEGFEQCDTSASFRWLHPQRSLQCICMSGTHIMTVEKMVRGGWSESEQFDCESSDCVTRLHHFEPLTCNSCPHGYYQDINSAVECYR